MTVEERLATIEEHIRASATVWNLHTQQDKREFDHLNKRLDDLNDKIDKLRYSEAKRQGEIEASQKRAGLISGGVATSIIAIIEAVRYTFNL
jgi:tetrahydromethanopterin S-methyltransferase subunit G